MKTNEFRIGNLIKYRDTICEVSNLGHFFRADKLDTSCTYGTDNPEEFEPIKLTEEWLLKFGFVKYGEKYHIGFNYGAYSVSTVGDVFNHWYLHHEFDKSKRITHNIQYVHQLQNLYFALTHTELKLK